VQEHERFPYWSRTDLELGRELLSAHEASASQLAGHDRLADDGRDMLRELTIAARGRRAQWSEVGVHHVSPLDIRSLIENIR
jgi:hypothetical protein